MLEFEWPDPAPATKCECCGGKMLRLTRFVTEDGAAHAVVYISYTDTHPDRLVKFAVSIGEWWHDDHTNRRCFTVWYKDLPDAYGFMLQDPECGDWQDVVSLGAQLSRSEALSDPLLSGLWKILDHVVANDPVLHPYLCKGLAG